jgi:hypothetical protein
MIMERQHKNISRQNLIDKARHIVDAPYTAIDEDFYKSPEWLRTRDKYIEANPFCELCLSEIDEKKKSDHVHHIMPLTAGGEPFSEDNLIALCTSCHSGIHSSAGIGVEISIDSPFGPEDHINNFTTQLKNINERAILQCKEGDQVILVREPREDYPGHIVVTNKQGEYLGDIHSGDEAHHYLAFDIVHGSEISAVIKEIFTKKNKLQCIIEITKSEIDWKECERFDIKEREVSELINEARQLETTDYEKAIQAYRKATGMLIDMDKECEKYPATWRGLRFPIYRISLILEKQKKYKECLEEIEHYQKYDDKVRLYAGEKESIEKRRIKMLSLVSVENS